MPTARTAKKPNPTTEAARKKLVAMSKQAKEVRAMMVANAPTVEEAIKAEDMSINDVLLMMYREDVGAGEFKTFKDWKAEGYKVKAKEKAFRIWGQPLKARKPQEEGQESEGTEATDKEAKKYKLWPMCCLFHVSQVEPMGPDGEPKREREEQETGQAVEVQGQEVKAHDEGKEIQECAFTRVDYDQAQESKAERYSERAAKAEARADGYYKRSQDLVGMIPLGQPILVGHHSEKRHRATVEKSHQAMHKSIDESRKADRLKMKAQTVGSGGIATDDPGAMQKLQNKLEEHERTQRMMKGANAASKRKDVEAFKKLGFGDADLDAMEKSGDWGGRLFARYQLQNNNAEIRRIKQRIEELKTLYSMEAPSFDCQEFEVYTEEGRIVVNFKDGKPGVEARRLVGRCHGYNFSRSRGSVWVRKATLNATRSVRRLIDDLQQLESIY